MGNVQAQSPRLSPRSFSVTASSKQDALKILVAQVEAVARSHEITVSEDGQWIQVSYFVQIHQDISNPTQWHASITI